MAHADTSHVIRTSLWIRPKGEAFDRIRHAIRRAHHHDGGLPVDPHVTLLSSCGVVQNDGQAKLRHLAQRVRPFTIRLGRIEGTAHYYRALYAVVEPSAELTEARRIACETFEMTPSPFRPHLSLLYGNFGETRREALVTVLGGWLGVSFTASAVDLVSAARDVPIADWRTLYEHPLVEK